MIRRLLPITLCLVSLLIQSHAGGWTCHLYKLKVETDSETIVGYVYFEDGFRAYFKNNEIKKYLSEYHRPPYDTISVYDTIYNLNFPEMEANHKLTAALKHQIRKVPVQAIRKISTLIKGPCTEWTIKKDPSNYEDYYAWVGHTMATDLTMAEIGLLMTKPAFSISFQDPSSIYSAYFVISYSDEPADRINATLNEFKNPIKNYSGKEPIHIFQAKRYSELKAAFRKKRIIIIKIGYVA